jgi:putative copper resistance protein D
LSIYTQTTLIAPAHYHALKLSWLDPIADQRVGGGLLWSSGEMVGLIMLGVVTAQWIKASEREAVREDRRLDRLEAAEAAAMARQAAAMAREAAGAAGLSRLDTMAVNDARPAGSAKKEVPS